MTPSVGKWPGRLRNGQRLLRRRARSTTFRRWPGCGRMLGWLWSAMTWTARYPRRARSNTVSAPPIWLASGPSRSRDSPAAIAAGQFNGRMWAMQIRTGAGGPVAAGPGDRPCQRLMKFGLVSFKYGQHRYVRVRITVPESTQMGSQVSEAVQARSRGDSGGVLHAGPGEGR